MTKILLFTLSLVTFFNLNAQIQYTDYGNTWLISMDAPEAVDLNADGIVDFYINSQEGKLGFTSVEMTGCFQSENSSIYNNIGTREMQILQEGDLVKMTTINIFDYIDNDKTAIYDDNLGFADGWSNLTDQYIGFGVLEGGYVYNGWMKIAIYKQAKAMYIKEIAYSKDVYNEGGITVGDKGVTNIPNLEGVLNQVEVSPNPAVDYVQLKYDYQGQNDMTISIQSTAGQEITRLIGTQGVSTLNIPLYDCSAGLYFIRFETKKGVHVEKVMLTK